jgi:hypothetical protein
MRSVGKNPVPADIALEVVNEWQTWPSSCAVSDRTGAIAKNQRGAFAEN